MNQENDEIQIDIREIMFVLWKHIAAIIIVGIICAGAMFAATKFLIKPSYQSTTKIYVKTKDGDTSSYSYSDLQTGSMLTKDYAQLIKSRAVTEKVIENMGLTMKPEQLAAKMDITTPSDTRVMSITVTDHDPEVAQQLADNIRDVAGEHIKSVTGAEAVNIVETANLPDSPSSPSLKKNTLIGGMLGVLLVCAIVIIQFLMNDSINIPEDVEKYLGLSVIGTIPLGTNDKKSKKKSRRR